MRATPKKDTLIKFRGETELKKKLVAVARNRRKALSSMLREEAWDLVDREVPKAKAN